MFSPEVAYFIGIGMGIFYTCAIALFAPVLEDFFNSFSKLVEVGNENRDPD